MLEARDRVGGRTYTVDAGAAGFHDLGGQWVGPTQEHVAALLTELGLRTFPTWTAGDSLAGVGAELSRYRGRIPRLGVRVLADALQAQLRLDRMAKRVPADRPWDADARPGSGMARRSRPGFAGPRSPQVAASTSG